MEIVSLSPQVVIRSTYNLPSLDPTLREFLLVYIVVVVDGVVCRGRLVGERNSNTP